MAEYITLDMFLKKENYTITDLAYVLGRQSQTIRLWERKKIILPADKRDSKNWRLYSRRRFLENLEKAVAYDWGRNRFSKEKLEDIVYIINKMKISL